MSINEDDEKVTVQLRDKIKSKMDVAKFFSSFIPLFLGLAFKDMITSLNSTDPEVYWTAWIGILSILLALAFSIATMFALDRLLMPPEFWKSPPAASLNRTLKNEMVSAWIRLFYPAVLCFLVGIAAFLGALTRQLSLSAGILAITLLVAYLAFKSLRIGREIHG